MITKIFIYLLIITFLPDLYIYCRYIKKRKNWKRWKQFSWWIPCTIISLYIIKLAALPNFIPNNPIWIEGFFMLLAFIILPKLIFTLCSILGLVYCRYTKTKRNWGNLIGLIAGLLVTFTTFYGFTWGFHRFEVKHIDLSFDDLPSSFDGYKIIHISDIHIGTFNGIHRGLLEKAVDSINAQHADAILFTGDLQNQQPEEIIPFTQLLSSIKAKDGVYSVFGNHDYSYYIKATDSIKAANERKLAALQRRCGWTLLMNQNKAIKRNGDSLVIIGTGNDGISPFPSNANYQQAMRNINSNTFKIMLQHDPSAWKHNVLSKTNAQLTLSGHTHAGQLSLFDWYPIAQKYAEYYGLYSEQMHKLYVTSGLGGTVPFRLGVKAEIVVITLHRNKQ